MTSKRKTIQIILTVIGIALIFTTYFLYPKFDKKIAEKSIIQDDSLQLTDKGRDTFENVEYKALYNFDTSFSVQSDKAHILNDEPDLVYMNKMKVTIHMNDGRVVIITSDEGSYNKITTDCIFFNNVKVTDGETVIFSENLDLIASEDSATIYNDVFITNDKGSLMADKIDYNFETKYYKASMMFNNKKVKVKLIRWVKQKNLEL